MVKTYLSGLLAAALGVAATLAQAQVTPSQAPSKRADPLDAKAVVPETIYKSSLAPAQTVTTSKPLTWQEANDNVTRMGGWRAYAREAQEPAKPLVPPNPVDHSGHKKP